MTRPFRRLVVAPREIAPPVKRHRNDQHVVGGKLDEQPRPEAGQQRRELQPVTMLEAQDKLAGAVGIMKAGTDGIERRRRRPAAGTERVGKRMAKRQAAPCAERRGNRRQPAPAVSAQAGGVGKPPAQHALMRQDQACQLPCRCAGGMRDETGPDHDPVTVRADR